MQRRDLSPPPTRIVHLGLGGFFRAHGAWYTAHAPDGDSWGITAFSGRSHDLVDRLAGQDGLYTLTTRLPEGDRIEVIPSIVAAHPGTDDAAWRRAVASPQVAVLTLTVTEAAYAPGPASVAARLVDGLAARRAVEAGPITLVPCDNVADNAGTLRRLVVDEAERRSDRLADWIDASVAFVGTVVDRITPRPTGADVTAAAAHGYNDAAPVVTEPFSEWVLSGEFAAGRPDWESAGARFTDDLTPFTRRKLHLLNGAHSLLAYAGLLRGHTEVAEAIADPILHSMVEAWWDEAAPVVGGEPSAHEDYRRALVERFANPRMHHALAQIAVDGSVKLVMRVVPVAIARRRAGRAAPVSAAIIGSWIAHCRDVGADLCDARRDELDSALQGPLGDATRRGVGLLDDELAADDAFVAEVTDHVRHRL